MANYGYDEKDCIFCKISRKEINPLGNGLIYEDEEFMAWLSPYPNTLGFSVVTTKKHYPSDVLKLDDDVLSRFVIASKKVAKLLEDYFDDVGRVGLIMEGTGINHAHIKFFPMHGTGYMKKGEWKQHSSSFDKYFKKYEGYIASNDSQKTDLEELELLAKKIKKN
ncbi:MAG: HIT family protein [Candidatus Woesearchaeota archaeon]